MLKIKNIWLRYLKKQAKDKVGQLESIDEFDEIELSNKKTKLTIVGKKKDNIKKSNFEEKVLNFMEMLMNLSKNKKSSIKKIGSDVKEIKSHLDVLETKVDRIEKDIKDMKSTPTMSRELKKSTKY